MPDVFNLSDTALSDFIADTKDNIKAIEARLKALKKPKPVKEPKPAKKSAAAADPAPAFVAALVDIPPVDVAGEIVFHSGQVRILIGADRMYEYDDALEKVGAYLGRYVDGVLDPTIPDDPDGSESETE